MHTFNLTLSRPGALLEIACPKILTHSGKTNTLTFLGAIHIPEFYLKLHASFSHAQLW